MPSILAVDGLRGEREGLLLPIQPHFEVQDFQHSFGRTCLQAESPSRKVLIYRLGSLGDTAVALPCFHLIARAFPDSERRLLTNFPVHAKAPASAAVLGDASLPQGYSTPKTVLNPRVH